MKASGTVILRGLVWWATGWPSTSSLGAGGPRQPVWRFRAGFPACTVAVLP